MNTEGKKGEQHPRLPYADTGAQSPSGSLSLGAEQLLCSANTQNQTTWLKVHDARPEDRDRQACTEHTPRGVEAPKPRQPGLRSSSLGGVRGEDGHLLSGHRDLQPAFPAVTGGQGTQ